MADNSFRPRPGRFGVHTVYVFSEKIGAITSAATDTFRIPTPFRKARFVRASAQAQTVPVVTTGTSTARIRKLRASDATVVTVSGDLDLETLVANEGKLIPLGTATDAAKTLNQGATDNGDTLLVEIVNGTTIPTQPVALYFVVELAILE